MFLSNVRSAVIVAINIPLALLFAFSVLYLRGKSANLLSIGAVDFGIIVDSAVIMVENIYRHLTTGARYGIAAQGAHSHACSRDRQGAVLLDRDHGRAPSLPLFTMTGPRASCSARWRRPMPSPWAAPCCMALTLTPVLCLLFFKHVKPTPDNFLVRFLKNGYLWQLDRCLQPSLHHARR